MYVVASNFGSRSVVILLGLSVDELHQQSGGRIVRLMLYLSHPILSLPQSRSVPAVRRAGHLPNQDGAVALARSHARAAQSSRYDFRLFAEEVRTPRSFVASS